jgi:hypothetical protein
MHQFREYQLEGGKGRMVFRPEDTLSEKENFLKNTIQTRLIDKFKKGNDNLITEWISLYAPLFSDFFSENFSSPEVVGEVIDDEQRATTEMQKVFLAAADGTEWALERIRTELANRLAKKEHHAVA